VVLSYYIDFLKSRGRRRGYCLSFKNKRQRSDILHTAGIAVNRGLPDALSASLVHGRDMARHLQQHPGEGAGAQRVLPAGGNPCGSLQWSQQLDGSLELVLSLRQANSLVADMFGNSVGWLPAPSAIDLGQLPGVYFFALPHF